MTAAKITQRDRAAAAVPLRLLAAAGLSIVGFTGIERIRQTIRLPGAEGQLGEGGVGIYAASILDGDGAKVQLAAVVWAADGQSAAVEWTRGKGHRERRRFAVAVDDEGFVTIVRLATDEVVSELRGEP